MSLAEASDIHKLDPMTYEVVRHRLWSINDEACMAMVHASGSPVVHSSDFNFAIYTADGDMAIVGMLYMIPVGTMSLLVRTIRERFGDQVEEGDVFFCNDPYIAAAHQNDVGLVAPYFSDGELVGWTGCTAHELDVGGMTPGSWCPGATEVHQEGIRIPPVRLRRGGALVEEVWEILMTASRLPHMLAMDLTAIFAAHEVAHRRLTDLAARYGVSVLTTAMAQSIEQSETTVREALRALPDGVFTHADYLDHDGLTNEIFEVVCTLRKLGDSMTVDFTGSSAQAPGFVNSTRASTLGAIATAIFPLLGAEAPSWNEGIMRPIEVILPPDSIVNPSEPAPVSSSSVAGAWIASHAMIGAVGKMLVAGGNAESEATGITDGCWPLLNVSGLNQYGEPFGDMFLDPAAWGGGAYAQRDGVDSGGSFVGPRGVILDVETKENSVPVLYLWRRQRRDSGGPGRHRGGVTIEFAVTPYGADSLTTVLATNGVTQPNCAGLFGGLPGGGSGYDCVVESDLFDRLARSEVPTAMAAINGRRRPLEAKTPAFGLKPGDVLNVIPQGGGGFGDPLDREPSKVRDDVSAGLVSRAAARAVYGVDPDAIDVAQVEHDRAQIKALRLVGANAPVRPPAVPSSPREEVRPCGDALETFVVDGRRYVGCRDCAHALGSSEENWKLAAASQELKEEELGTGFTIDPRMAVVAFACPSCARLLDVEIGPRGSTPRQDFAIDGKELA